MTELSFLHHPGCYNRSDIGILWHSTTDITDSEWEMMRAFTRYFVQFFDIGAVDTHVGIVSYDSTARIVLELREGYSFENVYRGINNTVRVNRGSNLIEGMRTLWRDFFSAARGDRAGYPNFGFILMTENPSVTGTSLTNEVSSVSNANIVLSVFDFGYSVSESVLQSITSSSRYWRITSNEWRSASSLESRLRQWVNQFCPNAPYLTGGGYNQESMPDQTVSVSVHFIFCMVDWT